MDDFQSVDFSAQTDFLCLESSREELHNLINTCSRARDILRL